MSDKQLSSILVIDDNVLNRQILSDALSNQYNILLASDGVEGLEVLAKNHDKISAVLLDLVMPRKDGFEVLRDIKLNQWEKDFPILMISSDINQENITKAYEMGIVDFIPRPFIEQAVIEKVTSSIKAFAKQKFLIQTIYDSVVEREKNSIMLIEILSHMAEYRNGESGLHVKHIKIITKILLEKLISITDKYNLTDDDIELIGLASSLHDIGKIGIPLEILNKPGRLTPEEFDVMKKHSEIGYQMIVSMGMYQDEKLVKYIKDITYCHHEKYDGRGYPRGLKGEEIPVWAQVVSIADCYDALRSERCYKPAYTHEQAIKMITGGECGLFSDLLIKCLLDSADEIQAKMSDDAEQINEEEIKTKIMKLLKD